MLDIIVTHYKEPWKTGEKFFMMLDLQRDVDWSKIHLILVNDGNEGEFDPALFENRPYHVKQFSIPHGGVSAARNAGLMAAQSKWVMFCDFDDMFSNVYALRSIQDVMPADGFDMLWSDIVIEDFSGERGGTGKTRRNEIYPYGQNTFFIHGKLYRRQFLLENQMFFDTSISYSEDTLFNRVLDTYLDYKRVGKICSAMPLYIWTYTPNSVTTSEGKHYEWYLQMFHSNKKLCQVYKERMPYHRHCNIVYKTVWEVYRALNHKPMPDGLKPLKDEFKAFWRQNKAAFYAASDQSAKEIDKIQTESEPKLSRETMLKWLDALEKESEK